MKLGRNEGYRVKPINPIYETENQNKNRDKRNKPFVLKENKNKDRKN